MYWLEEWITTVSFSENINSSPLSHQVYNQSQYSKRSIHKALLNSTRNLHLYQHAPRMVPHDAPPRCHNMYITVETKYQVGRSNRKANNALATSTDTKQPGE